MRLMHAPALHTRLPSILVLKTSATAAALATTPPPSPTSLSPSAHVFVLQAQLFGVSVCCE